jgi:DNA-binding MarR family transcriptional regulator
MRRLITNAADQTDRRIRAVLITRKGRAKLRSAITFWHRAQGRVQDALGADVTATLNGLLDLTSDKLKT